MVTAGTWCWVCSSCILVVRASRNRVRVGFRMDAGLVLVSVLVLVLVFVSVLVPVIVLVLVPVLVLVLDSVSADVILTSGRFLDAFWMVNERPKGKSVERSC